MKEPGQSPLLNSFILATGILLGAFITTLFLLNRNVMDASGHFPEDDEEVQMAIAERIEPVGEVLLMGSDELEEAAAVTVAMPEPDAAPLTGPQVYNQACFACHSTPGIGAPILGDQAEWEARVAQGMDTLIEHALNGFVGETGVAMPAKGGQPNLSDDEVIAAVEYMLDQLEE